MKIKHFRKENRSIIVKNKLLLETSLRYLIIILFAFPQNNIWHLLFYFCYYCKASATPVCLFLGQNYVESFWNNFNTFV